MGYNTAILLLNDGLDQLEKDPQAGRKIRGAILRHGLHQRIGRTQSFGIGFHANMGQVISCDHADFTQVLIVGQNRGESVTRNPTNENLEELARLLRGQGYVVYKRKAP